VWIAPVGRRKRVRCDAGNRHGAIGIGVVEPEPVGERYVSRLHRLADLDHGLGGAAAGGDARSAAVLEPERVGVLWADAQRATYVCAGRRLG
jgi:hypothetical protein